MVVLGGFFFLRFLVSMVNRDFIFFRIRLFIIFFFFQSNLFAKMFCDAFVVIVVIVVWSVVGTEKIKEQINCRPLCGGRRKPNAK